MQFRYSKINNLETLETEYAEYERWKDHKIFRVELNNKQIIVQEKKNEEPQASAWGIL
jgi:hypothetical protein